ncbi:MAG: hypothetical protein HY084_04750 [Gemmatimonadetes bacterium]|nr:hypothetical protein [Gemmatimonadota bacterium]
MGTLKTMLTTGASLCVFDERGRVVGIIPHPVLREPLGKFGETVYLARPETPVVGCAAA